MKHTYVWWVGVWALVAQGCGPMVVEPDGEADAAAEVFDGGDDGPGDAGPPDAPRDAPSDAPLDAAADAAPDAAADRPADGPDAPSDAARDASDERGDVGDAPDARPDAALDVAPDAAPDAGPDAGLDATPDARADAAPDAGPDARPDVALDARPDAALDAAPDARPDAPPDAALDATVDARPDVVADALPDARPDAAPDASLDATNDRPDALDAAPDARPDAAPDAAADVPADLAADVPADAGPVCETLIPRAARPDPVDALDPPRLLSPASTARVASQQPRLRWRAGAGATGATVELCRSRDCAVVAMRVDVAGQEFVPAAPLARGTWWWRVTARRGATGGAASSATWSFRVGPRSAPGTSWAPFADFDGDGYADFLVPATDASRPSWVVYGAPAGRPPVARRFACPGVARLVHDTDGDGFSDVLLGAYVFHGSPGGALASPGARLGWTPPPATDWDVFYGDRLPEYGVGDLDADGAADLLGARRPTRPGVPNLAVWGGRPTGVATLTDAVTATPFDARCTPWQSAGDVDGDERVDLVQGCDDTESGSVYYLPGADVASGAPQILMLGHWRGQRAYPVGDANGDGFPEFVGVAATIDLSGLPVGRPSWCRRVATAVVTCPGMATPPGMPAWFHVDLRAAGDVDGDGFDDAVSGSTRQLLRGSISGEYANPMITVGDAVGVGDLDGDGFDELAVLSPATASVTVVYGASGGPRVAAPQTIPLP